METLKTTDFEIYNAIKIEKNRQQNNIELIASENIVSNAVMEAVGSILTNKYAEGYPGKRYYGGCECVDALEEIAKERLIELFRANEYHANVQPHSGSQANMAVYMSVLEPGDTVLGMDLSNGGHLTHGSPVNFSGKLYNFEHYGVDDNGYIDYDKLREQAIRVKPKMIVCGASAYPRIIHFNKIRSICDEVGAYMFADISHIAGLVVTNLHPTPVGFADFISSTTHKTLRGTRGGVILCKKEFAKQLDKTIFPGMQGGPLMHIIAGKAVTFGEAMKPEFTEYQNQVLLNSKILCNELKKRGFNIVSNGTDNHLMLIDLTNKGITGKDAEKLLGSVGITVNKNTVPNETLSPFVTSGIRIGTPAITTRGFIGSDMSSIAMAIDEAINNNVDKAREIVQRLCDKYPM